MNPWKRRLLRSAWLLLAGEVLLDAGCGHAPRHPAVDTDATSGPASPSTTRGSAG
jgi:hypothetical protein